jgi:outer membrane protein TolC
MKDAAEWGISAARSSYLPILSGTAGYGYTAQNFPPDGRVWTVGLNVTVPLFSGFSSAAQVREAAAGLSGVEAQRESARLQIGKEVEAAWLDEKDAAARVVATDKELAAARESQTLAMERYREGVGTLLEATDAQAQALSADTARIQAEYDRNVAVTRLERALGRL